MPKKTKLNLSPIKVHSFITSLEDEEKKEVKGGCSEPPIEESQDSCTCLKDCGIEVTYETCITYCGTCTCGTCNPSTESNPPNCETYDCTIGYCC